MTIPYSSDRIHRTHRAGSVSSRSTATFSITDAATLAGAAMLFGPAWFAPERHLRTIGWALRRLAISDLTQDPQATAGQIRRTLGARLPTVSGHDILGAMAAEGILTFLQVLRSFRFDRWAPAVRLASVDRIRAAQETGRGVILWVAHGFHGHLGAKVAFHQSGLSVSHLSKADHGFSASRFGMDYLNRLQTVVEDRYLAERILLPMEGRNSALNAVVRRLRANGIVSITAQRGTGRTVKAPFLDGRIKLAPGGPALAYMTGATLLPVFAFRDDAGVIDVTVEPPIEIASTASRGEAETQAMKCYVAKLEPYVVRHLGQWLGWGQL